MGKGRRTQSNNSQLWPTRIMHGSPSDLTVSHPQRDPSFLSPWAGQLVPTSGLCNWFFLAQEQSSFRDFFLSHWSQNKLHLFRGAFTEPNWCWPLATWKAHNFQCLPPFSFLHSTQRPIGNASCDSSVFLTNFVRTGYSFLVVAVYPCVNCA